MTTRTARIRPRSAGAVLAVVLLAVAAAGCMAAEERTFLDRTNALRADHGLPALHQQLVLNDKAEAWAQHMAATGTLEHSSLTAGLDGLDWRVLGENVGVSTPTGDPLLALHEKLVSSPTHRANLLDSRMTHMGVGVATSADGRVWVAEVFAAL